MQIVYKNTVIDVKKGTMIKEILSEEIIKTNAIAARFNNEIKSLNHRIDLDGKLELIDISDKDGMRIYRRGLLFITYKAFEELFPNSRILVNYQLSNALLCEVKNEAVTEEMIDKVNAKIKEIIEKDFPIEKKAMTREQAQVFYENNNTTKGMLQLESLDKQEIMLYYCDNYYNYFFGVLPVSTGFANCYEIIKYHTGFLVRYPNRKAPNILTPFQEQTKLLETLDEYENVHQILDVDNLYKLNNIVKQERIKEFILLDEALHEKKIANIADDIIKRKKVKVVLIAGPSSSGKTTFAQRLSLQLRLNGFKPVTISVDNYFVERPDNPKDEFGNYDFECIEAIDTKLFNDHLIKLLNGEEIQVPKFDFEHGTKQYTGETMKLAEDEILVIEGIHCLNDKLTELIPKEQKYKIYISALTVLNLDYYNRISTTDTRLIRRIVRDYNFRGYSALHTLKMWESVNRGEEKNIFPFQEEADAMFNSSLIYELSVLKNYAMPLLAEITNDEPQYSEAKRLYKLLEYFKAVPSEYVPNNSLLREFIGGSVFHEKEEERIKNAKK